MASRDVTAETDTNHTPQHWFEWSISVLRPYRNLRLDRNPSNTLQEIGDANRPNLTVNLQVPQLAVSLTTSLVSLGPKLCT